MKVTSILPAIEVTKETGISSSGVGAGCTMFITNGDTVKVSLRNGIVYEGVFVSMNCNDKQEKDVIIINTEEDSIDIPCNQITDIDFS